MIWMLLLIPSVFGLSVAPGVVDLGNVVQGNYTLTYSLSDQAMVSGCGSRGLVNTTGHVTISVIEPGPCYLTFEHTSLPVMVQTQVNYNLTTQIIRNVSVHVQGELVEHEQGFIQIEVVNLGNVAYHDCIWFNHGYQCTQVSVPPLSKQSYVMPMTLRATGDVDIYWNTTNVGTIRVVERTIQETSLVEKIIEKIKKLISPIQGFLIDIR